MVSELSWCEDLFSKSAILSWLIVDATFGNVEIIIWRRFWESYFVTFYCRWKMELATAIRGWHHIEEVQKPLNWILFHPKRTSQAKSIAIWFLKVRGWRFRKNNFSKICKSHFLQFSRLCLGTSGNIFKCNFFWKCMIFRLLSRSVIRF